MVDKQRNGLIDLFRLVFIIGIVYQHASVFGLNKIGGTRVEFFFILTGYLFANSIKKYQGNLSQSLFQYLVHKLKGFYLQFVVSTVLASTLISIFLLRNKDEVILHLSQTLGDFFLWQIWGLPVASATGIMWYLSAMMGALLIIFPFFYKWPKFFGFVVSPSLVLLIYQVMAINYGKLDGIIMETIFGGVHLGLVRAIAGISLGIFLYSVNSEFRKVELSKVLQILLTFLEVFSYLFSIYLMLKLRNFPLIDFTITGLFAVAVLLSFSEKTIIGSVFQYKFFNRLGTFSLYLFLNHYYIARIINLYKDQLNMGNHKLLILYAMVSISCALIAWGFCIFVKKCAFLNPNRD